MNSPNRIKIAFLTGQSDRKSIALSPVQTRFMDRLPVSDGMKLYYNFPYKLTDSRFDSQNRAPEHIILSSINNVFMYLNTYRKSVQRDYRKFFMETFCDSERIILLAGSAGAEYLRRLDIPEGLRNRIYLFTYGAVGREFPSCASSFSIRGKKDFIARLWGLPVNQWVESGHLDYLENDRTMESLLEFLREIGLEMNTGEEK